MLYVNMYRLMGFIPTLLNLLSINVLNSISETIPNLLLEQNISIAVCKVVIYKYVFVGFNFVSNLIVFCSIKFEQNTIKFECEI